MPSSKVKNRWERTNVTNLLRNRQSGTYYARVKVNGKQKWRSLETDVFSVAKLRLGDKEKELRQTEPSPSGDRAAADLSETIMGHYFGLIRERTADDPRLAPNSKLRREIALKAVEKTWPGIAERDIRRITVKDCRDWGTKALQHGTGFVAPRAKTTRAGMSASAFNKAVDVLRTAFEMARQEGVIYRNPAAEIPKAPIRRKQLALPNGEQFKALLQHVLTGGSKWSQDCADLVRLLAYSGMRLREATSLRWEHVDFAKKQIQVPGTKSESSRRVIPIFPGLGDLLEEIRARRGIEPGPAAVAAVAGCRGALESACVEAGIAKMNHHDLRHLFATRCIESGVDVPTVSRWLGHSDGGALAMKTYGHLRQEHSQTQAAKVNFA